MDKKMRVAGVLLGVLSLQLLLSFSTALAEDTFVDWIAVDLSANTASGFLGSISVTLTTQLAVPTSFGGAGVLNGVTNGTSTFFANASYFTPSVAATDHVGLGAAGHFSISFSSPVTNATLHIVGLSNNQLSFTDGAAPLAFTLVSSDGDLVVSGSTVKGPAPALGDDGNGSLRFDGPITQISWTVISTPNTGDGMAIQLSVENSPVLTCLGFESPMNGGPVKVKGNRALPLKSRLFDASGFELTGFDLASRPAVQVLYDSGDGNAVDVSSEALPAGHGDDGNQFVYTDEAKWQYNLKTSHYSAPGTYTVLIASGDAAEYVIDPACAATFVIR